MDLEEILESIELEYLLAALFLICICIYFLVKCLKNRRAYIEILKNRAAINKTISSYSARLSEVIAADRGYQEDLQITLNKGVADGEFRFVFIYSGEERVTEVSALEARAIVKVIAKYLESNDPRLREPFRWIFKNSSMPCGYMTTKTIKTIPSTKAVTATKTAVSKEM